MAAMAARRVERRGLMFVLSSPSGAGKTTLSRDADGARTRGLKMSVSVTTRPMRPGEVDGGDYLFVDDAALRRDGGAATSCSNGRRYSTISTARRARRSRRRCRPGSDVLFDIDWQGTQQLRAEGARRRRQRVHPAAVRRRSGEAAAHPRAGFRRGDPRPHEPCQPRTQPLGGIRLHRRQPRVDEAFAEVQSILKAERLKRERRTGLTEFVRKLQRQLEK